MKGYFTVEINPKPPGVNEHSWHMVASIPGYCTFMCDNFDPRTVSRCGVKVTCSNSKKPHLETECKNRPEIFFVSCVTCKGTGEPPSWSNNPRCSYCGGLGKLHYQRFHGIMRSEGWYDRGMCWIWNLQ